MGNCKYCGAELVPDSEGVIWHRNGCQATESPAAARLAAERAGFVVLTMKEAKPIADFLVMTEHQPVIDAAIARTQQAQAGEKS